MSAFPQELRDRAIVYSTARAESLIAQQILDSASTLDEAYPDLFIAYSIAFKKSCEAKMAYDAALAVYMAGERK